MNLKSIFILYLLFIPLVSAGVGRTFDVDFNVREGYDLWLQESDRVLFNYGGYSHTIIIDEIKQDTVELDVFLFLERGLHTPHYTHLTKKYNLRLDFDKDGEKELGIDLLNIELDKGKANIVFRKLEVWDSDKKIELEDEKGFEFDKDYLYVFGGIVLILVILSFVIIYIRKEKDIYY